MPRIPTSLIRLAYSEHPYLPLLLQTCRELPPARSELRWLREYVRTVQNTKQQGKSRPPKLLQLCKERALGKPLQYILGTQPFGDLEILCRKKVLIPRPETESYTLRVADLLLRHTKEIRKQGQGKQQQSIRILDLCTGSGCIALLLHAKLAPRFSKLEIIGVDKSDHALKLARRNLAWNIQEGYLQPRAAKEVKFIKRDILGDEIGTSLGKFHLVISNPPYISQSDYRSTETSRSVRQYEPLEALVPQLNPQTSHKSFYPAIMAAAESCEAELVLFELGSESQAHDTLRALHESSYWRRKELWLDDLGYGRGDKVETRVIDIFNGETISPFTVPVIGTGNDRAVIAGRSTKILRGARSPLSILREALKAALAEEHVPAKPDTIARQNTPSYQDDNLLAQKNELLHQELQETTKGVQWLAVATKSLTSECKESAEFFKQEPQNALLIIAGLSVRLSKAEKEHGRLTDILTGGELIRSIEAVAAVLIERLLGTIKELESLGKDLKVLRQKVEVMHQRETQKDWLRRLIL